MRVLIVDDDDSIRRILTRCLTAWGWEAEECQSIGGARAAISQAGFALALCDVDLPDGDGVALALMMRGSNPSLGVVMISGNPENLDRARRCGLTVCLQKPFELRELKELVEREAAVLTSGRRGSGAGRSPVRRRA
ncbi:MAG: Two-component transcriptional regulator [Elusimicrobia bacterium]|nr:MAG: Two-component transcriptional regulator [Elusimicrobiota bacterium]